MERSRATAAAPAGGWAIRSVNSTASFRTATAIETQPNIVTRGLWPVQLAAGVTGPVISDDGEPKLGKGGKPLVEAKYTGMHALRHFVALWCIKPKEEGGRELPAKVVQERLGHS